MIKIKTYSTRFAAQRAARAQLSLPASAAEGVDFTTAKNEDGTFSFAPVAKVRPATPEPAPAVKKAKPTSDRRKPAPKATGKRAAAEEAAKAGVLPTVPDFSAETHRAYRKRLDAIVALVKAGDIKALEAEVIPTYSTSPRAIARYRDLAVIALRAKKAA